MALPQYNNDNLIANIKRRCSVPTSQLTYTDEDFCLLATDELQGTVVPLIMSSREEYFVDFIDVQVEGGDSQSIDIPDNAVGSKLRSVCLVQQSSPLVLMNLPRIDLDVVAGVGFSSMQTLAGFYVQGNKLMIYPSNSVSAGQTIRLFYYKRALALAVPEQYGRVTSVDLNTNTIVVDALPFDWATGTELNIVSSNSPYDVVNSSTIVTVSSPSIILDDATGISVGDYVSDLGFSAVAQIPQEAHAYLAQLTAVKCLEGLGDNAGMQAAQAKADDLKRSLLIMISQRVDGSVKKVISPNGGMRLRAGLGRIGSRRGGTW